jgi:hypothetical protein
VLANAHNNFDSAPSQSSFKATGDWVAGFDGNSASDNLIFNYTFANADKAIPVWHSDLGLVISLGTIYGLTAMS